MLKGLGVRWRIVVWIFVIAAVSYLDRNNISIAASLVQRDFGLSNIRLGYVFSAFVLGYALAQPFAGSIADEFGPYRSVAAGILWWSVFTTLTALVPVGSTVSLALLLAVRFLLGIGEAIIFPASNRLVADWIPSGERGLANGIIFAGVGLGGGVAPPLITALMIVYGWHVAFYVSAAIGLIVAVIWLSLVKDRPQDHSGVTPAERAYIAAGIPSDTRSGSIVTWPTVIFDRQVAFLTLSYFCYGYVAYIFFTWLFKYLSDVRGLDLKASAVYTALPFIAMALASALGGLLSDRLCRRFGGRVGRCGVAGCSLLVAGCFVWSATQIEDARAAALVLAGGAGALYLAQSAFWALSADIGGATAGRVSGVMNMGSQLGGVVTASLSPVIASAYGWTASFTVAAAVCVIGAGAWIFIDPAHTLSRRS